MKEKLVLLMLVGGADPVVMTVAVVGADLAIDGIVTSKFFLDKSKCSRFS